MMRPLSLLLVWGALVGSAPAEGPKNSVSAVRPFLDDSTVVVVHVDLTAIKPGAVRDRLVKLEPKLSATLKHILPVIEKGRDALLQAGVHNAFVVVGTNQRPNQPPVIVLHRDALAAGNPIEVIGNLFPDRMFEMHGAYVFGPQARLETLRDRKTAPDEVIVADLTAAFAAAEKSPARVAVIMPPGLRRVLSENLPMLPPPFADVTGKEIARGFRWAVLALDGDAATGYQLRLHVQADNAETAGRFVKLAETGLDALANVREVTSVLPLAKLRQQMTLRTEGTTMVARLPDTAVLQAMLPAAIKVREAAAATVDMNSLKQIGLAFHNHASANRNRFPTAAITDNQGQPLLSWRVRLLPYLGAENKQLYEKFRLNEPWDSDHNQKLLIEMPAVYRASVAPNLTGEGKTTFVVPVGPDTIFPPGKAVGLTDITDGTSNTILAVQIDPAKAVPWTKPADLDVDPKQPLATDLGFDANGLFMALFADGSVRRIAKTIEPRTLAAVFTRNGGEVVNER